MTALFNNFNHQDDAIERSNDGNVALIHDCGTGKTLTALQIARRDMLREGGPTLVICPRRLIYDAWLADAKLFMPDLDIVAMYGPERDTIIKEDHEVYVTSFDTFKNMFNLIRDRGFKVLLIDESSKMKSIKTQITKFILTLAGFRFNKREGIVFGRASVIPCRHALSATPAPNSPLEYWGQAKLITGPGNQIFNDNFYSFRNTFFSGRPIGLTGASIWTFRTSMFEEFCDKLAGIAHVVRKEDANLNLPPQHETLHEIDLGPMEEAAYRKFEKECVLRVKDEWVIGVNKLAEIMKLRELSSGFIYGEEGNTHIIGSSKFEYLRSIVGLNPGQRIIWINFKQEARMAKQFIPDAELVEGNLKQQMAVINDFKAGNIPYLIANQQSLSHGLTFVNCSMASYVSENYSYELSKQSKDRIHRIGQVKDCYYDRIHARNTIDSVIYKANKKKEKMTNDFLGYLVAIQQGTKLNANNCRHVFDETSSQAMAKATRTYLQSA